MIKIRGYIIKYKPFDNSSRVNFHHTLFGRLVYRKCRGKKYTYYVQGMLDKTPFLRIMNSKIFVLNLENINLEELRIFSDVEIKECEREISIESMKSGESYWRDISNERGLELHVRNKRKR